MIDLSMQLKTIAFSFLYGILLSFLFNVNYRLLFFHKKIVRLLFDFIFIIDFGLLYFYLLQFLDYGYIHIYFFAFIVGGFFLSFSLFKRIIRKHNVKK